MSIIGKPFLVVGDFVMFDIPSNEGAIIVLPHPPVMVTKGKSNTKSTMRFIAVQGEEKMWQLPAWPYFRPPWIIPGTVSCEIMALDSDQILSKIKDNGIPVLSTGKKGTKFRAMWKVTAPAKQPSPPLGDGSDDPLKMYTGTGQFVQILDSKSSSKS